jgi:hypothetical protein
MGIMGAAEAQFEQPLRHPARARLPCLGGLLHLIAFRRVLRRHNWRRSRRRDLEFAMAQKFLRLLSALFSFTAADIVWFVRQHDLGHGTQTLCAPRRGRYNSN